MMDFRFRIVKFPDYNDKTDLFLWAYDHSGGKSYSCQIKKGFLELNPKEDSERGEPFLNLGLVNERQFLSALVEGLKDAGYVAEVDNAQRITAQAVAEEREKEINWLRAELSKLLGKGNVNN